MYWARQLLLLVKFESTVLVNHKFNQRSFSLNFQGIFNAAFPLGQTKQIPQTSTSDRSHLNALFYFELRWITFGRCKTIAHAHFQPI